jgi:uncharacterized phiE125 gp8 family phage protein
MTTRLITPPAALAVDLTEATAQLRIDGTDMDAMVTAWIEGISAHAEHYMQRSIITQTWRVTLDKFPDAIKLYNPPLVSVSYVKYYDVDGVLQTLDPADYVVDSVSEPGYIVPAPDVTWPDTECGRINAVIAEFVCGYGATHADVPKGIKLYIMAKLVEQYDPNTRPEKDTVQSSFIDCLLDRYKVWGM